MSHIYQPVMLMALLRNHGQCTVTEIAYEILSDDQSQIEYYEKITRDMVGCVLRKHEIVTKQGNAFILNGFRQLSADQINLRFPVACHGDGFWV
jgi:ATP adenylyltransferase